MAKYRKKPVVIEAWLWTFNSKTAEEPGWVRDALHKWPSDGGMSFEPDHPDGARIIISTLEGAMIANPGDYIIKGVKGEIYPCKPDIFAATYDQMCTQASGELAKHCDCCPDSA